MQPILLQIDFAFAGPFGAALHEVCAPLAADIATEPGLRWKLWTEDPAGQRAGGVYLFERRSDAERYLAKHLPRLQGFGVESVRSHLFEVNLPLSALTRGPVGD